MVFRETTFLVNFTFISPRVLSHGESIAYAFLVVLDVESEGHVIDHLEMDNYDEGPGEDGLNEVATLACIAPDLELVAVTSRQIQVLCFVETQLLLPIISTVVVLEEEVVVRGD